MEFTGTIPQANVYKHQNCSFRTYFYHSDHNNSKYCAYSCSKMLSASPLLWRITLGDIYL